MQTGFQRTQLSDQCRIAGLPSRRRRHAAILQRGTDKPGCDVWSPDAGAEENHSRSANAINTPVLFRRAERDASSSAGMLSGLDILYPPGRRTTSTKARSCHGKSKLAAALQLHPHTRTPAHPHRRAPGVDGTRRATTHTSQTRTTRSRRAQ
jgi:hypothetical protein